MITIANGKPLEELAADGLCIVDFYSDTCAPCKILAMVLSRLESEFPFLNLIKANLSTVPEYGSKYDVRGVPTLLFYNNGELKERTMGVLAREELEARITRYLYE